MAAAVAAAATSHRAIDQARRERTSVEAGRQSESAAARARDVLRAELDALRLTAHNAVSNPRLMAAVRGRVDARTFGDLFATEPWWEPYRQHASVGVSYEGTQLAFAQTGLGSEAELSSVLEAVRANREPRSEIVLSASGALLAAAALMPMPAPRPAALLVVSRPVAGPVLRAAADRAGSAVLLSDRKRALASAGPADGAAMLAAAVGREAERRFHQGHLWAAAALPVAKDLWLWAGATALRYAHDEAALDRTRKTLLWSGAGLVAALALLLGRRRPALEPAPVESNGRSTLGRYLLLDRIAEGGVAEIYTAVAFGTQRFRRSFVIKRLRPEMTTNTEAVAQFIDEANLASTLVHANIVPVFDFGQIGSEYYLAMEYVVGRDLGRLTRRLVERGEPPLPVAAVLYVAHEVLAGLEYAHAKRHEDGTALGIVHRDVSPENVMISERGEVKLLDFGIVKAAQGRVTKTEIGLVKGNVDFMAPEQARGRAVDGRTDLFSLGLVIYFALAQRPLYSGETVYDRLVKCASGLNPEDLARIDALPAPIPDLLARALATDPDQRFSSAAEFRQAVAPHIEGGREALTATITRVFGDDLALEQDRLAAGAQAAETAAGA